MEQNINIPTSVKSVKSVYISDTDNNYNVQFLSAKQGHYTVKIVKK